jgi:hypothetical protein
VHSWQSFRPQFAMLQVVRSRIGWVVPCIGMTATLPDATLRAVRKGVGFSDKVEVLRTPIDRPEIFIGIDTFQYAQNSFEDLFFLLPQECTKAQDIPKTVVYFDSIPELLRAHRALRAQMNRLKYPQKLRTCVHVYFSWAPEYDKKVTSEEFILPDKECNTCRILLATDSYSLGINNPDIMRIVQWKITPDVESLYQRMGRAVRNGLNNGQFLMLYSADRVPVDDTTNEIGTGTISSQLRETDGVFGSEDDTPDSHLKEATRQSFTHQKARQPQHPQAMTPAMASIFAPGCCIRKTTLKYLGDTAHEYEPIQRPSRPCCSGCQPELVPDRGIGDIKRVAPQTDPLKVPWRLSQLKEWRQRFFNAQMPANPLWPMKPEVLISDKNLRHIADAGENIRDSASFWKHVKEHFEHRDMQAMVDIMKAHPDTPGDKEPFFTPWFHAGEERRAGRTELKIAGRSNYSALQIQKDAWDKKMGYPSTLKRLPKSKKRRGSASSGRCTGGRKKKSRIEDMQVESQQVSSAVPPQYQRQDSLMPPQKASKKAASSSQGPSRQPLRELSANTLSSNSRAASKNSAH